MKGGKPMDKFERFKVLARQIHPQTGKRGMIAEAHNQAAVQKTRWPGPSVSGGWFRSLLGSQARSTSSLRKGYRAEIIRVEPDGAYRGPTLFACSVPWRVSPSRSKQLAGDS